MGIHIEQHRNRVEFSSQEILVSMGVIPMSLLLPFNSQTKVTVQDLQSITQLPVDIVLMNVQTLLDANLIISDVAGCPDVETVLSLNMKYTNKRSKFKVTAKQQKDVQKKDLAEAQEAADQQRKYIVQATIIRIMKSRQVLVHNSLIKD